MNIAECLASLLLSQDPKAQPVTITIIAKGHNSFDVHLGETYVDRLCWDEMLGQIAMLTLLGKERYPMLTPEEYEERRMRWSSKKGEQA